MSRTRLRATEATYSDTLRAQVLGEHAYGLLDRAFCRDIDKVVERDTRGNGLRRAEEDDATAYTI